MGNPDLTHLPTAEEYALFREAYAETYPVRPLMNAIDAKDAEIARLKRARREAHVANLVEQRRVEAENKRLREELKIADARSEKIAGTAARRTAEAWEEERKRLHAALRAARPCVFNSRHGGWEEALRLVDEALREESRGGPAECRP